MMREVPSAVHSAAQAAESKPIELYEVFLDSQTLYFAQDNDYVIFGVQTYSPIGVSRTPVRTSADLEVDEVTLQLDNVDKFFAQEAIKTDFVGRRITVKKVFRDQLDSASKFVVVFDGRMDEPSIEQSAMTVHLRSSLDALHIPIPRRVFSTLCNYQHYDISCAVSKTLGTNIVTGTAVGPASDFIVFSVVLSHSSNYWGPVGTLKMFTGSNANVGREVISSTTASLSANVRIPFPYLINSGDIFSIQRGCRKTITDCISKFGNFPNYGGFPTIPKHPII